VGIVDIGVSAGSSSKGTASGAGVGVSVSGDIEAVLVDYLAQLD
jgi:hypothetical protein